MDLGLKDKVAIVGGASMGIGYGIARIVGEFFREPDAFLGFLWAGATMGQLLSIPMLLVGGWLISPPRRKFRRYSAN